MQIDNFPWFYAHKQNPIIRQTNKNSLQMTHWFLIYI